MIFYLIKILSIFFLPLAVSSFLQGNRISCSEEGKIIKFAFLEQDPCITCQCRNGTVDCFKNHCQTQNIFQNSKLTTNIIEKNRRRCVYASRTYQHSESWMKSCRLCTCTNGHVKCVATKFNCHNSKIHSCSAGQELRQYTSSDCCPKCVSTMLNTSPLILPKKQTNDRLMNIFTSTSKTKSIACSLDQNNNVNTFDGHDYTILGKCNYAFVRDCSQMTPTKRTFSVHLVQKFNFQRNLLLRIRFRDKTIYLSHLGRIRINKQLVKLPYLHFGQFSIVKMNNEIRFKSMLGLEIRFEVNRTVEIKVKDTFNNKLCGLCGNFNGDPNDDLRAKRSQQIVDLERFLYSYKVGKTPFCKRGQKFRSVWSFK